MAIQQPVRRSVRLRDSGSSSSIDGEPGQDIITVQDNTATSVSRRNSRTLARQRPGAPIELGTRETNRFPQDLQDEKRARARALLEERFGRPNDWNDRRRLVGRRAAPPTALSPGLNWLKTLPVLVFVAWFALQILRWQQSVTIWPVADDLATHVSHLVGRSSVLPPSMICTPDNRYGKLPNNYITDTFNAENKHPLQMYIDAMDHFEELQHLVLALDSHITDVASAPPKLNKTAKSLADYKSEGMMEVCKSLEIYSIWIDQLYPQATGLRDSVASYLLNTGHGATHLLAFENSVRQRQQGNSSFISYYLPSVRWTSERELTRLLKEALTTNVNELNSLTDRLAEASNVLEKVKIQSGALDYYVPLQLEKLRQQDAPETASLIEDDNIIAHRKSIIRELSEGAGYRIQDSWPETRSALDKQLKTTKTAVGTILALVDCLGPGPWLHHEAGRHVKGLARFRDSLVDLADKVKRKE